MLYVHRETFILNITFALYLDVFVHYPPISVVLKLPVVSACSRGKFIFTSWICNPPSTINFIMNLEFGFNILIVIIKILVTQTFIGIQQIMSRRKKSKNCCSYSLYHISQVIVGGNPFSQTILCKLSHIHLDLRSKFQSNPCR